MNKKDFLEVKKLVNLLESTTGKKVKFAEIKKKKVLKEADEATMNGIVDKLTQLSEKIWGMNSSQITTQSKSYIGSSIDNIIKAATEAPIDIAEDVSMTIDQAEKDPDMIKKFGEKDIDVKLTDKDGDEKSSIII